MSTPVHVTHPFTHCLHHIFVIWRPKLSRISNGTGPRTARQPFAADRREIFSPAVVFMRVHVGRRVHGRFDPQGSRPWSGLAAKRTVRGKRRDSLAGRTLERRHQLRRQEVSGDRSRRARARGRNRPGLDHEDARPASHPLPPDRLQHAPARQLPRARQTRRQLRCNHILRPAHLHTTL